ncbi:hypothetical protein BB559_005578 [Furculomyces boomerangus]|uniref:Uncharacterized protein n=1 Tax=Furculomyces boomerangus TaxID=61424 RepID=A0A2T9Y7U9_9FUNG|nr:hypothetical protein BB559_005578 [Furculomyces boomerangus]
MDFTKNNRFGLHGFNETPLLNRFTLDGSHGILDGFEPKGVVHSFDIGENYPDMAFHEFKLDFEYNSLLSDPLVWQDSKIDLMLPEEKTLNGKKPQSYRNKVDIGSVHSLSGPRLYSAEGSQATMTSGLDRSDSYPEYYSDNAEDSSDSCATYKRKYDTNRKNSLDNPTGSDKYTFPTLPKSNNIQNKFTFNTKKKNQRRNTISVPTKNNNICPPPGFEKKPNDTVFPSPIEPKTPKLQNPSYLQPTPKTPFFSRRNSLKVNANLNYEEYVLPEPQNFHSRRNSVTGWKRNSVSGTQKLYENQGVFNTRNSGYRNSAIPTDSKQVIRIPAVLFETHQRKQSTKPKSKQSKGNKQIGEPNIDKSEYKKSSGTESENEGAARESKALQTLQDMIQSLKMVNEMRTRQKEERKKKFI